MSNDTMELKLIPSGLSYIIGKLPKEIPDRPWNSIISDVPYKGSYTCWNKADNYRSFSFTVIEEPAEKTYPGRAHRTESFAINSGIYDAHYLWAPFVSLQNEILPDKDYRAGISRNMSQRPDLYIEGIRPMTKREILAFYKKMCRALEDFPYESRRASVRQDLREYCEHALKVSYSDWQMHELRQDQRIVRVEPKCKETVH
jgi:hypothetical protein